MGVVTAAVVLTVIVVLLWSYRVYVVIALAAGVGIFVVRKSIAEKKAAVHAEQTTIESTCSAICSESELIVASAELPVETSSAPCETVPFQMHALRAAEKKAARERNDHTTDAACIYSADTEVVITEEGQKTVNFDSLFRKAHELDTPYKQQSDESDGLEGIDETCCFEKEAIPLRRKKDAEALTDYVVLDFETTGLSAAECHIIEIGALKVCAGEIVDSFHTLVDPGYPIPAGITRLTGITTADVAGAPTQSVAAMQLHRWIDDYPIVAHNAGFDLGFLAQAYLNAGLSASVQYIDTLALARRVFPNLENHKLGTLVDHLDLSSGEQLHRALNDVICTQRLLCACIAALPERRTVAHAAAPSVKINELAPTATPPADHPLNGQSVVFTGELSIPRESAAQKAVDMGAVIKTAVSRKTNYLVVGQQDPSIVGDDGMSSKERTAKQLACAGCQIQIIDEQKFIELLTGV